MAIPFVSLSGSFGVKATQGGIVGIKALDDMLVRMPKKIQNAIMRKAMMQALKPFYRQAKLNAPVQWQRYEIWNTTGGFMSNVFNQITRRRRGRLKKSIARRRKSMKWKHEFTGSVFVNRKKKVYYAHLSEWGTKGHYINNYFGHAGTKKFVKGQQAQLWMTKAWHKTWRKSLRKFKYVIAVSTVRQFKKFVKDSNAEARRQMISSVSF